MHSIVSVKIHDTPVMQQKEDPSADVVDVPKMLHDSLYWKSASATT